MCETRCPKKAITMVRPVAAVAPKKSLEKELARV
jgi:hypothetical protein